MAPLICNTKEKKGKQMSKTSEMIVWMNSNNITNNKKVIIGKNDKYFECVMDITNSSSGKLLRMHRCDGDGKKKDRIITLLLPPSFQSNESLIGTFSILDSDDVVRNVNLSYKYSYSGVVINIRDVDTELKAEDSCNENIKNENENKKLSKENNTKIEIGKQLDLLIEEKNEKINGGTKSRTTRKKFPYNRYQIMTIPRGFSQKFYKYIQDKGMTRKEVGDKFDVSERTIGRIVNEEVWYINKQLYKRVELEVNGRSCKTKQV
jgi:hypothetical protein